MNETEARAALQGYFAILERAEAIVNKMEALVAGKRHGGSYSFSSIEDETLYLTRWCCGSADSDTLPISVLWDKEWEQQMDEAIVAHNLELEQKKEQKAKEAEQGERATYEALRQRFESTVTPTPEVTPTP